MFWLIAAMLTGLVLAPLFAVLLRGGGRNAVSSDIAIYRDQLSEIDRDVARGILPEEEAERTRLEVQRRLLDADRTHEDAAGNAPRPARRAMAAAVALCVAGGGFALYFLVGAPGYPDLPLSVRIEQSAEIAARRPSQDAAEAEAVAILPDRPELDPEYAALMERLREVVEQRPDDQQGLRLLARNEASIGDFRAARIAQERLVTLLGADANADDLATLGEFMVLAAGGFVTPQAEAMIDRSLTADPGNGRAAYYKGLALAQIGRPDQAFAVWSDVLERDPDTAPWIAPIRGQIGEVATRAGIRYDPPAAPRGPSEADMAAAADMSEEDRAAMIGNMVAGLSDRLATQGGPSPDWARLIVAYSVLGEAERARAILDEAREVFAASPEDLANIDDAAARAGLAE